MYVAGIRFAVFVIELLLLSFNSFCAVGRVGVFGCANSNIKVIQYHSHTLLITRVSIFDQKFGFKTFVSTPIARQL